MILKFRVISLKDSSKYLKNILERNEILRKQINLRHEIRNEFIIIGEEIIDGKEYFKVNQLDENTLSIFKKLDENGLSILEELDLATISWTIPKKEFRLNNTLYKELDISKQNLTLDLINDIKKLNN